MRPNIMSFLCQTLVKLKFLSVPESWILSTLSILRVSKYLQSAQIGFLFENIQSDNFTGRCLYMKEYFDPFFSTLNHIPQA